MADLALEIALRNARLRAWRALGVPVEGRWTAWSGGDYRLLLECGTCGVHELFWLDTGRPLLDAHIGERGCYRGFALDGCPHLAPLLSPEDPPDVVVLTELELLAL